MRIVPVFGKGALDVSPRIGHVHISVDDAPWHFVDIDVCKPFDPKGPCDLVL